VARPHLGAKRAAEKAKSAWIARRKAKKIPENAVFGSGLGYRWPVLMPRRRM
jgi:hypothetical protein